MIATSAALAFGPAIDAARSPERRVRTKLTTRTVRHTRAASHNRRTMNKTMSENYDSGPVTASSDLAHGNGDIEICLRFLHMLATCSPLGPSQQQRPPPSMSTMPDRTKYRIAAKSGRPSRREYWDPEPHGDAVK